MAAGVRRTSGADGAVVVLLITIAVLAGPGCGAPEPDSQRAIVIAVDGASHRMVDPMIDEGLLPNLAAIRRAGVSGPIRSPVPALSPRIWTSVVTGKPPERHGILGWVWKDDRGSLQLYSSADRSSHAIWNILSDRGFRVGVVNWLNTHPPEKINGVMISDFAFPVLERRRGFAEDFGRKQFPDAKSGITRVEGEHASYTHPRAWLDRIAALRDESANLTPISDPFAGGRSQVGAYTGLITGDEDSGIEDYLSAIFADDGLATRMAIEIQQEVRPDLLLAYLPGVDRASHFIWPGAEPIDSLSQAIRPTPEMHAALRSAIRDYYRYVDALIGLLVADLADDDLVMVLSDHGFEASSGGNGKPAGIHESRATEDGIFFARGRGIPAGSTLQPDTLQVNDITPTLLAWFGLPGALDMEGEPAAFLDSVPMGLLASYDTTPIERLSAEGIGEVEETIKGQLESLGYIEEQ